MSTLFNFLYQNAPKFSGYIYTKTFASNKCPNSKNATTRGIHFRGYRVCKYAIFLLCPDQGNWKKKGGGGKKMWPTFHLAIAHGEGVIIPLDAVISKLGNQLLPVHIVFLALRAPK